MPPILPDRMDIWPHESSNSRDLWESDMRALGLAISNGVGRDNHQIQNISN